MIDFLKYGFHNLLSPVLYEGTIQSGQMRSFAVLHVNRSIIEMVE